MMMRLYSHSNSLKARYWQRFNRYSKVDWLLFVNGDTLHTLDCYFVTGAYPGRLGDRYTGLGAQTLAPQ